MYLNKQEQKALIEAFDIIRSSEPSSGKGWVPETILEVIKASTRRNLSDTNKRYFANDKLKSLMVYPYGVKV